MGLLPQSFRQSNIPCQLRTLACEIGGRGKKDLLGWFAEWRIGYCSVFQYWWGKRQGQGGFSTVGFGYRFRWHSRVENSHQDEILEFGGYGGNTKGNVRRPIQVLRVCLHKGDGHIWGH